MERMLKVQMVKFAAPRFNSMSSERRKRREEADYGIRLCASQQTAERLQSGTDAVRVLKIASNQYMSSFCINYRPGSFQLT